MPDQPFRQRENPTFVEAKGSLAGKPVGLCLDGDWQGSITVEIYDEEHKLSLLMFPEAALRRLMENLDA